MVKIVIDGENYDALATVAKANYELRPSELAGAWNALSPDVKAMRMVRASRLILSFEKWSGLNGSEDGVSLAVSRIAATIEDRADRDEHASNVRRASLGSMSVEFFSAGASGRTIDPQAGRLLDAHATTGGKAATSSGRQSLPVTSY